MRPGYRKAAQALGTAASQYAFGLQPPGAVPTAQPYPEYDVNKMMSDFGLSMAPRQAQANTLGSRQLAMGGYGGTPDASRAFAPAQQTYQQQVLAGEYPAQYGKWQAERNLGLQQQQAGQDAQSQYLQSLLGVYQPTRSWHDQFALMRKKLQEAKKKRNQASASARVAPLKSWLGPFGSFLKS